MLNSSLMALKSSLNISNRGDFIGILFREIEVLKKWSGNNKMRSKENPLEMDVMSRVCQSYVTAAARFNDSDD